MTAVTQNTGSFMLSKEIEILMAERAKLLRVAGAAAQFVAVMDSRSLPGSVATEAEILAESVNALAGGHAEGRAALDHPRRIHRILKGEAMNRDAFNMSIRKFLKTVGVHSQREIEAAVERALASGKLKGNESLPAKMTLTAGRRRALRHLRRHDHPRVNDAADRRRRRATPTSRRPPGASRAWRTARPVATSRQFDALAGCEAYFKCENLQRMGAFKFRGAYNALAQLDAGSAAPRRGRLLVGQPRAGGGARGQPARHSGDDRDARRRAGGEGRRHPRLRRRGRPLRPRRRAEPRGSGGGASRASGARR